MILKDGLGNSFTPSTTIGDGNTSFVHLIGNQGQQVMAASVPVTLASDSTPVHTGGTRVSVVFTPTVTSGSAYASGNQVGQVLSFASATRTAAGTGSVESLIITDLSAQSGSYDLWLFSANPTHGTYTDKTNLTINASDIVNFIGLISFSTWSLATSGGGVANSVPNLKFKLSAGTTLYGILITRATPTYTSTSALQLSMVISQD